MVTGMRRKRSHTNKRGVEETEKKKGNGKGMGERRERRQRGKEGIATS